MGSSSDIRDLAINDLKQQSKTIKDESCSKKRELDDADEAKIELDGRKRYFALRNIWSFFIIIWITALIIFNIFLTIAIGLSWLKFETMNVSITTVTVETFLQIVGMGYVAVKFLFSHK